MGLQERVGNSVPLPVTAASTTHSMCSYFKVTKKGCAWYCNRYISSNIISNQLNILLEWGTTYCRNDSYAQTTSKWYFIHVTWPTQPRYVIYYTFNKHVFIAIIFQQCICIEIFREAKYYLLKERWCNSIFR